MGIPIRPEYGDGYHGGGDGIDIKRESREIHRLGAIINQKQAEFDRMRQALSLIRSVDCEADRVQASKRRGASYEGLIDRLVDIQTSLNRDIEILVDKRKALMDKIQKMDNPLYVEVLYLRYVERKYYEVIADEMGYSPKYIRDLTVKAVRAYEGNRKAG